MREERRNFISCTTAPRRERECTLFRALQTPVAGGVAASPVTTGVSRRRPDTCVGVPTATSRSVKGE